MRARPLHLLQPAPGRGGAARAGSLRTRGRRRHLSAGWRWRWRRLPLCGRSLGWPLPSLPPLVVQGDAVIVALAPLAVERAHAARRHGHATQASVAARRATERLQSRTALLVIAEGVCGASQQRSEHRPVVSSGGGTRARAHQRCGSPRSRTRRSHRPLGGGGGRVGGGGSPREAMRRQQGHVLKVGIGVGLPLPLGCLPLLRAGGAVGEKQLCWLESLLAGRGGRARGRAVCEGGGWGRGCEGTGVGDGAAREGCGGRVVRERLCEKRRCVCVCGGG